MHDQRLDDLLVELRAAFGVTLTGGRYVSYPDKLDTPSHWWGENLLRLQAVVDKHDPHHLLVSRLHPFNA